MSDEEVVDPKEAIDEHCAKSHCSALEQELQKCEDRVNSRTKTEETCQQELFDFLHCVNHCAVKPLWEKLV